MFEFFCTEEHARYQYIQWFLDKYFNCMIEGINNGIIGDHDEIAKTIRILLDSSNWSFFELIREYYPEEVRSFYLLEGISHDSYFPQAKNELGKMVYHHYSSMGYKVKRLTNEKDNYTKLRIYTKEKKSMFFSNLIDEILLRLWRF